MQGTQATASKRPTNGKRAILRYNGALTFENCAELMQDVMSEIQHKRAEVILDFKHVVLLDSAALEVLVDLNETMTAQGKRLKIIRIQGLCKDILMSTRILPGLNTYDDLHAAITDMV